MAWTLIWSTLSSFDGCHSGTSHIVCTKTRPGVALFYLHWHAQILGVMIDISIVNGIIHQLIIGGHHLASFSHQQHIKNDSWLWEKRMKKPPGLWGCWLQWEYHEIVHSISYDIYIYMIYPTAHWYIYIWYIWLINHRFLGWNSAYVFIRWPPTSMVLLAKPC